MDVYQRCCGRSDRPTPHRARAGEETLTACCRVSSTSSSSSCRRRRTKESMVLHPVVSLSHSRHDRVDLSSHIGPPGRLLDHIVSHVGLRVLGLGRCRSRLRDSQQIHPAEHGPKGTLLPHRRHHHLPTPARPCRPRHVGLATDFRLRLGPVSRQGQFRAVPGARPTFARGGVHGAALGLVVARGGRHREQQLHVARRHHDRVVHGPGVESLGGRRLAARGGEPDCQGHADVRKMVLRQNLVISVLHVHMHRRRAKVSSRTPDEIRRS